MAAFCKALSAISIHALLAESDFACAGWFQVVYYFYPRSPCGERPGKVRVVEPGFEKFLSTLSLRRATEVSGDTWQRGSNFYPRSPCGERLEKVPADVFYSAFLSTLSLRRATLLTLCRFLPCRFLSTLSLRRATGTLRTVNVKKTFLSTLSLRRATEPTAGRNDKDNIFLSTLSLRRAT